MLILWTLSLAIRPQIVEQEINPFVEQWERDAQFDAHKVFKALGNAGLLGLTRPTEFGGQGLNYSFTVAFIEELSRTVNCGGVNSGIAVQTDMALPALANFGSDELRRQFLAPSLSGDFVACVGISEAGGGSDVAGGCSRSTAVSAFAHSAVHKSNPVGSRQTECTTQR